MKVIEVVPIRVSSTTVHTPWPKKSDGAGPADIVAPRGLGGCAHAHGRGDGPRPLITCWNYWMAVPTGDQTGLMDLLGLVTPRPVSFTDAIAVLDADTHSGVGEDGVFGARVYL